MTKFTTIPTEPQDPIYGLQLAIKQDKRADKSNLSIGILINEDSSLKKFDVVLKTEELIRQSETKAYLPIDGLPELRQQVANLLLPTHANSYTAQTVGGTGALYVGAMFLSRFLTKEVLIPDPTWVNHHKLFQACGFTTHSYPYKAQPNGHLDIQAIIPAIQNAKEGSAIVLQASCHNPTGIDPTMDEWQQLSFLILEKKMIPIFDLAYQGLGNGLAEDVLSIDLFARDGHEFLITTSFAKNFGIYSERIGALTIVSNSAIDPISSQIKKIIRTTYSSPPAHGARIVATILSDSALRATWERELATIRESIGKKRKLFQEILHAAHCGSLAASIEKGIGLFSQLHIPIEKILELRQEGIYLADDGRINIAAVTETNAKRIAHRVAR